MAASTGNIKKIAPFSLSSFLKNKKKNKKIQQIHMVCM
jgi:hypothetical protein